MAGAAITLALAACAQASAGTPPTDVAGIQIARQAVVTTGGTVAAPATDAGPQAAALGADANFDPPPLPVARPAGERVLTAAVNGADRQWTVVIPPGTTDDQRMPLLIVLHGVGGKGSAMRRLGFEKYAASAGVLVAYPDALGGSWNDGRPGMEPLAGAPADDLAFFRELSARTAADAGADPKHVAIAGFSNGALMASRAACDMTDQLQSVVLVSGSGPRDMTQRCKPSRPLSVMVVFGTSDLTVPYEGGQVATYAGKSRGQVAPVREVLDVWRSANGCVGADAQEAVGTKPVVTALRGKGCRADLVHYKVTGGGHEWFSAPTFDTTGEAWRFVSTHLG